ncbi:MAG: hypothetical protein H6852_17795 [Geminicoccaceae bacterium]|nr:hypothetical protein [Geminicoccaceae bacterium]
MLLEIAQIEGAMLAIGIGEVEAALAPEQLDDARRRKFIKIPPPCARRRSLP